MDCFERTRWHHNGPRQANQQEDRGDGTAAIDKKKSHEGCRVDWKTSSINKPQEGVYNRLKGTMHEATNKTSRNRKTRRQKCKLVGQATDLR